MDIRAEVLVPFPRLTVFAAYRDRMADLVKFLPNIRGIDFKSRTQRDHVTEVVSVWHGGGEIPAAARAFLTEAMLSWTDTAQWDEQNFTCHWRVEPHSFREGIKASGTNQYLEVPDGTRVVIEGSITVDGKNLRGVPSFLAKSIAPKVEEYLVGRIKPNLIEVGHGVKQMLTLDQSSTK